MADGHRQCRANRPSRRREGRFEEARRPSRRERRRAGPPREGVAGGRLARSRRPRQRDLVIGRRHARGLSPAGLAGRCRRRPGAARCPGADRPDAEPRWPGPLRVPEPAGPRRHAGSRALQRRARRALARRPLQSLPVRHEPRLVRADPARDARAAAGGARLLAARERGPARAGRRQHLLFRAAGRSAEPAHHQEPACRLRSVRPRQRAALRRARLAVLHPRGLRRVLSGLWRLVADVPGLDRHDLRAGLGARPVVRAERRHPADVPRRRHAALQRRDRHRHHRREESRAAGARLPGVSQERGGRGREGPGARVRARAGPRPVSRRPAGPEPRHAGHRGAARHRAADGRRPPVAGRHLPGLARAAVGPPDSQPAGSPHPAAR